MAEANGPRRALNLIGLDALDLRTCKVSGDPWDFSKKSDRDEARKLVDTKQPMWIIGNPPCTLFSSWQHVNFRNLSEAEIDAKKEAGRVHLKFVASLYRKQVRAGRFFLHEHPHTATSWREPCIRAVRHMPDVATARCDQCMYDCVARSTGLPAMKPTKCRTHW